MKKITNFRYWIAAAALALAGAADAAAASGIVEKLFVFPELTAAPRTYADKAAEVMSVKDFGAKCNGVADDLAAVRRALDRIQAKGGGYRLTFPAGRCKFSAAIGTYTFSNVEIDFGTAVLDFTGVSTISAGPLLGVSGTYGAAVSLTADTAAGVRTVAADTTGYAPDEMVRVYSNKVFDTTRTNTRLGEISFVRTVDTAGQLTLTTDAQNLYAVAETAKIQKLTPVKNVTIKNGSIIGPAANDELIGLMLTLCVDCEVRGVRSYDIDKRHIYLVDNVRTNVVGNFINQSRHATQAYGVSVADASRDIVVAQNNFVDVRHSLSTNNNVSDSWGITRRVWFANNTVTDSAPNIGDGGGGDAIDTHAGAEDIFIVHNSVYGSSGHGINFEARTGIISGNRVRFVKGSGIYANPRSDFSSAIIITDNTLNSIGDGVDIDYGIAVSLTSASGVGYVLANNKVESNATALRVVGTAAYRFDRVAITGNATETTGTANGVQLDYADTSAVTGNSIVAPSVGIIATNGVANVVSGNSVRLTGSGANGYGIRLAGTTEYSVVSGNSVWQAGTHVASWGVIFATTVTYSGAYSNVTKAFITPVNISTGTGNASANNL